MSIPEHLLPTRFPRAEVERSVRCIHVRPGTTIDMVLDPDFWIHGGSTLKVNDKIEVLALDGTFELELRCVAVDARGYWAKMRLLNKWIEKPGAKEVAPPVWPDAEGYRIEWAGQHHRFRIIDRAGDIVGKGYPSEAEAMADLDRVKREKMAA